MGFLCKLGRSTHSANATGVCEYFNRQKYTRCHHRRIIICVSQHRIDKCKCIAPYKPCRLMSTINWFKGTNLISSAEYESILVNKKRLCTSLILMVNGVCKLNGCAQKFNIAT
jgi:hypothetical protein